jgi:hypothetical protein
MRRHYTARRFFSTAQTGTGGQHGRQAPIQHGGILRAGDPVHLVPEHIFPADVLVTDCPGCVMQLKGGLDKRGSRINVKHIAELMAGRKKGNSPPAHLRLQPAKLSEKACANMKYGAEHNLP